MAKRDAKAYYDDFSKDYENERHDGYHLWLDEAEFGVLRPFVQGRRVLEAGCGTGLLLARTKAAAMSCKGVDLSPGMLRGALARGLDVVEGSVTDLPFDDREFDTVYSFKVLPHVEQIEQAMREMARVVKPGGHVLAEFYNPLSIRGAIKYMKPATRINSGTDDHQVYTRFDTLRRIRRYVPDDMALVDTSGIRILTPLRSPASLSPAAPGGRGSRRYPGRYVVALFRRFLSSF